jgi:tRNA (guanine-N7-)-methyltransferase
MPRKKLRRFAEVKTFSNVLEFPEKIRGKWSELFGNKKPIILELGCGSGEFTLGLARLAPDKNFIGADIQGERLWCGAKTALEENIPNVRFLRIFIEKLEEYFDEKEISDIWITFPDPHPRRRSAKRRLTSPRFLEMYRKIVKPKGSVYFKTDSRPLFDYSLESFAACKYKVLETKTDLHGADADPDPLFSLMTTFEKRYVLKGRKICFAKAKP